MAGGDDVPARHAVEGEPGADGGAEGPRDVASDEDPTEPVGRQRRVVGSGRAGLTGERSALDSR